MLSLSALENGEQIDYELSELQLHFSSYLDILPMAAQKLLNLLGLNWLIFGRCKSMLKSLKYVRFGQSTRLSLVHPFFFTALSKCDNVRIFLGLNGFACL